MLTAAKMAEWSNGTWLGVLPDLIQGFCIDSRKIKPGEIFVALSGEERDGHAYLSDVIKKGAAGAIVDMEKYNPDKSASMPCLLVKEPAAALIDIAAGYLNAVAPRVIAVTGSVGKSTVKELILQMLLTTYKTAGTVGNWNNDIGLPLSILSMPANSEFAVFELGTNHPGEIKSLAKIINPQCGVVTNIGPVHIEFFKTEKAIADEKADLLRSLPETGAAFIVDDTPFTETFVDVAGCKVVRTIGVDHTSDYYYEKRSGKVITVYEKSTGENADLTLPIPGKFNIINILLAVGVARWAGVSWDAVTDALINFRAMPMRWSIVDINEIELINDAYNANPLSMRAAIETFYNEYENKERWLVLGGMLELGEQEEKEHLMLGGFVAGKDWAGLIVVGELGEKIAAGAIHGGMPESRIFKCKTTDAVSEFIRHKISRNSVVLLKASRGYKLERIIENLKEQKGE